jgi:hypothetical protein
MQVFIYLISLFLVINIQTETLSFPLDVACGYKKSGIIHLIKTPIAEFNRIKQLHIFFIQL